MEEDKNKQNDYCIYKNKIYENIKMPAGLVVSIYLSERKQIRADRVKRRQLRDVSNPMDIPENAFIALYRLNKIAFQSVLDDVAPYLGRTSIPEMLQLAATLRFLAVGAYQGVIGNDMYISVGRTTMCKILWKVLIVLEESLCPKWINVNMSAEEISASKLHFYRTHGMPGVIGCIDGTHVRIIKPSLESSLYYNRKGYYSLNVMIICDYKMRIRAVDSCRPGSCHDSFIWELSDAKMYYSELHTNGVRNHWLLGDSGYGLEPYLITPYRSVECGSTQHRFNQRHCSARNIVERTIGNLKTRFRSLLSNSLHYKPEKVVKIVNVCCALHNVCKHFNIPFEEEIVPIPNEDLEINEDPDSAEGRNIRDNIARSLR